MMPYADGWPTGQEMEHIMDAPDETTGPLWEIRPNTEGYTPGLYASVKEWVESKWTTEDEALVATVWSDGTHDIEPKYMPDPVRLIPVTEWEALLSAALEERAAYQAFYGGDLTNEDAWQRLIAAQAALGAQAERHDVGLTEEEVDRDA